MNFSHYSDYSVINVDTYMYIITVISIVTAVIVPNVNRPLGFRGDIGIQPESELVRLLTRTNCVSNKLSSA